MWFIWRSYGYEHRLFPGPIRRTSYTKNARDRSAVGRPSALAVFSSPWGAARFTVLCTGRQGCLVSLERIRPRNILVSSSPALGNRCRHPSECCVSTVPGSFKTSRIPRTQEGCSDLMRHTRIVQCRERTYKLRAGRECLRATEMEIMKMSKRVMNVYERRRSMSSDCTRKKVGRSIESIFASCRISPS